MGASVLEVIELTNGVGVKNCLVEETRVGEILLI